MRQKHILGIKINFDISHQELANTVVHELQNPNLTSNPANRLICTINPEMFIEALQDDEFKNIINNSFLSVPDGIGIFLADYYLNQVNEYTKKYNKKPAKITKVHLLFKSYVYIFMHPSKFKTVSGIDLVYKLCSEFEKFNKNIFLWGGWPKNRFGKKLNVSYDLATKCADKLHEYYPNLKIIGATSQFSANEKDDISSNLYVKECMSNVGVNYIDLIFVALKHNTQEKWLHRNLNKIPCAFGIGVGGSYEYITQMYKRPAFIRMLHLEWAYRLLTQPHRYKRVLGAFIRFPYILYTNS